MVPVAARPHATPASRRADFCSSPSCLSQHPTMSIVVLLHVGWSLLTGPSKQTAAMVPARRNDHGSSPRSRFQQAAFIIASSHGHSSGSSCRRCRSSLWLSQLAVVVVPASRGHGRISPKSWFWHPHHLEGPATTVAACHHHGCSRLFLFAAHHFLPLPYSIASPNGQRKKNRAPLVTSRSCHRWCGGVAQQRCRMGA